MEEKDELEMDLARLEEEADTDLDRFTEELAVNALFRRLLSLRSELLRRISRLEVDSHFFISLGLGIFD